MNKFTWRKVTAEDYATIVCLWWKSWGWNTPPSLDMLPQDSVLVIHEETQTPVYAGFLYRTGTSIAWMEFVVSNKDATTEQRRGGKEYLFETISSLARYLGFKVLFTSTNEATLKNSLKGSGFVVGDENMYQLVKKL